MPEIALDRRRIVAATVALLLVLAIGGRLLLRTGRASVPPPVRVAAPAQTAPASRLFVHVVGAVRRPGLYRLAEGSRVADAVTRAGGPTRKAQLELVNLAARIADGEQVVVPRRGAAAAVGSRAAATTGPVHLNTATLEQLDALPGIGPVTAQKILDYRQKHGAFGSVDELDAIPGIGPSRLEQVRDLVVP
ncbi:MAG TPA: helix-hairpin-helix domain-containing protein [Gaiellaceae bacterium]|jgi:competence protein ComEA